MLLLGAMGCSGATATAGAGPQSDPTTDDGSASVPAPDAASDGAPALMADAGAPSSDAAADSPWYFPDGSCGPAIYAPINLITICGGQINQPTGVLEQAQVTAPSFVAYYAETDGGAEAADCGGPTSNVEVWTATKPVGLVASSGDCACTATYNCDCILAHPFTLSAGTSYALTIEAGTAPPPSCVMYQGVPYVDLSLVVNAPDPASQIAP